jgi:hypothetical protein
MKLGVPVISHSVHSRYARNHAALCDLDCWMFGLKPLVSSEARVKKPV